MYRKLARWASRSWPIIGIRSHLLLSICFVPLLAHCFSPSAYAQRLSSVQRTIVDAAADARFRYRRLPSFEDLSPQQTRLIATAGCGYLTPSDCWDSLPPDAKAIFFLVTHVLEDTDLNGVPLIRRVSSVICILAEDEVDHDHPLTGQTARVDGWRLHLLLNDLLADDLRSAGWCSWCNIGDGFFGNRVDPTHTAFGYVQSYRDHREHRRRRATGPFLQLVLDDNNTSSDSDLDRGRFDHRSSPKDVHDRFLKRYPTTIRVFDVE